MLLRDLPGELLELSAAYRHCRRLAFGHYENFPVAGLLLPQPQRNAIAALYAYARTADDYSDEPQFAGRRLALLKGWLQRLDRAAGKDPIFIALADARKKFKLPKPLLQDLVKAFIQDCQKSRYRSQADLLAYCRLSADPVGRLVLRVFKADSDRNLKDSDAICTALQLANHWQDLGSDISQRDRFYLPQDAMRRFKVTEAQLIAGRWSEGLHRLMQDQVAFAEGLFARGAGLPGRLPGRLGLQIGLTLAGGRRILAKIRKQAYNTLDQRPRLGFLDAPLLLWEGLWPR